METMKTPFVTFNQVTKSYPMGEVTVQALRGLNLEISKGEFTVILGPSGCGKTTTLNILGGLDRLNSGTITVSGDSISGYNERKLTEYRRNRIGFIFQFFNLIPTLTASENIEFAISLNKGGRQARQRSMELLKLVGLADRSDHFPFQLSGGEQQRVAIARALANRPDMLLCDEPTGNLDIDTGIQVLSVIHDLNRKEGTTVFLVTHNTAIAPMADRIIRMKNGLIEHNEPVASPRNVSDLVW